MSIATSQSSEMLGRRPGDKLRQPTMNAADGARNPAVVIAFHRNVMIAPRRLLVRRKVHGYIRYRHSAHQCAALRLSMMMSPG
jgi:hypothetical protein